MTSPFRWRRASITLGLFLAMATLTTVPATRAQEEPPAEAKPSRYAGMADVPGRKVKIGVDKDYFDKTYKKFPALAGTEREQVMPLLLVETPEHEVELAPYSIDLYEVTNAQYYLFMEKACRTSVFIAEKERAIEDVAERLYGRQSPETAWEPESIYIMNRAKLLEQLEVVVKENEGLVKTLLEEFNQDLPPKAPRLTSFDELPPNWQVRGWVRFRLPKDTALTAYSRVMPFTWRAEGKPAADQLSLPVQYMSGDDAGAFAEWAGKHVPTDEEWEYAARGPEGLLYPWGNTWDCEKQKNLILWRGTDTAPRGPAPPSKDSPIAVDTLPGSRSPFGCFHMLGNVGEWTSSVPVAWPGSESTWSHYGERGLRVIRGGSYGDGKEYKNQELLFRNTMRIIFAHGNGFYEGDRYQMFGFRCAKTSLPGFENSVVAARRLAAKKILPAGLVFEPSGSYGAELLSYDPGATNFAFVRDGVRFVGLTPIDRLPYPTAKHLLEAAMKALETRDQPIPLALLHFSPDLRLAAIEVVEPKKPEAPGETGEPGAGEGADGATPPAPPAKEEPPARGKAPAKGKAPPKGKAPKGGKAAPPPPPPEEVVPAGPTEEKRLVAIEEDSWVVCLYGNRLALFRVGIQTLAFKYWLYGPEGETGPATDKSLVEKVDGKTFPRTATFDGATGMFRAQIPVPPGSEKSKDIFAVRLVLHFPDAPAGNWQGVTAE